MKKKKLIIFGMDDLASVAYFYFTNDSDYEVSCFCANEKYITDKTFHGLKVVPFENIETEFPVNKYEMFIAIGYSKLNSIREKIYFDAKEKGYKLATYISSKATCWNDLDIGDNCFVLEDNTIQPFVKIGNNVFLWSGNHIGHHVILGDHIFVSSHVVISGRCNIGNNCFLGVNATINDHICIAPNTVVGSGALIDKDTEMGIYKAESTNKIEKEIYSSKYFKF